MIISPPPMFRGGTSLINTIQNLGLTTNLKLCLDASDKNSYDGTSQVWNDLSGNGSHFCLGLSGSVETSDPAFNGVAGRESSNEFFSGDGGDYFNRSTGVNDAWVKAMFKTGLTSYFIVAYIPNGTANKLFATETNGDASKFGGSVKFETSQLKWAYPVSGGFGIINMDPDLTSLLPGLFAFGLSVSLDASGNLDIKANTNGSPDSGAFPVSPVVIGDPVATVKIMAAGDGTTIAPAGSRIYAMAVWQGTQLSSANMAALYSAVKDKYGIISIG